MYTISVSTGARFLALLLPPSVPSSQAGLASVLLDYAARSVGLIICYCVLVHRRNSSTDNEKTWLRAGQVEATGTSPPSSGVFTDSSSSSSSVEVGGDAEDDADDAETTQLLASLSDNDNRLYSGRRVH
jgi:hypothetical protein